MTRLVSHLNYATSSTKGSMQQPKVTVPQIRFSPRSGSETKNLSRPGQTAEK
jgi:hypothetical protein